jgi:hypothetical protein
MKRFVSDVHRCVTPVRYFELRTRASRWGRGLCAAGCVSRVRVELAGASSFAGAVVRARRLTLDALVGSARSDVGRAACEVALGAGRGVAKLWVQGTREPRLTVVGCEVVFSCTCEDEIVGTDRAVLVSARWAQKARQGSDE